MAIAKAGIVTLPQIPLMFEAPTSVCTSFYKSKGWGPASRVVWEHLPSTAVCVFYLDGSCSIPVFVSPPLETTGFFQMESEATPEGVSIESFTVISYAKYLGHPT
ncbi:hypothetical protein PHYSODRAFT_300633 [Phytophthora sojae]|uniref:Uncharacterized protein n=1 Tax=Phytophthora sojae (strain P6497) TaxID=1094619 RepID=G4ZHG3_PHYSP|nr:hypothetical protein PHYSODRAFT_300633 [Phytophthora sojae]EGZ17633.1 hypothetical protein PHYSODRAFT_300633 [Phytophthora sojae]|eukprot:XP_009526691.1 hypothetical protein PHYSODRAFT_300633 [Phytophthora sojae]